MKFAERAEATFHPRGVWGQTFVLESSDLKAQVRAIWNPLDFFEPLHIHVKDWGVTRDEELLLTLLLLFYLCWIHFPQ